MKNFENPTDYAAFKKMVFDMTLPELDEYEAIIHRDIIKYYHVESQQIYIQDWSIKIGIISEERKNRRERIAFDLDSEAA